MGLMAIHSFHVISHSPGNAPWEGKDCTSLTISKGNFVWNQFNFASRVVVVQSDAHRRGDRSGLCFYQNLSEKENPMRRRLEICAIRRTSESWRGKNGSCPNTQVFAANTSSTLSSSNHKYKFLSIIIFF